MPFLPLLAIALALAMDAFAVALTTGVCLARITPIIGLRMAAVFGGFQFVMPVLGWLAGAGAQPYIEAYDHWLAFGLLALVGGRMLKEAWDSRGGRDKADCKPFTDPSRGRALWIMGVATSIDALAVGLSLALLGLDVLAPALLIGVVCFIMTMLGIYAGSLLRRLPGLEAAGGVAAAFGGLVLLAIGARILYEHGVFV